MTHLDPLLDRLAAFEPTTLPVLSFCLNTSSDQHGRDDCSSSLRKEKTCPLRSAERGSFARDTERVTAYLSDALRPSSNAMALCACAGGDGFFEHVQLDAPMEGHRLYVADRPHLYPPPGSLTSILLRRTHRDRHRIHNVQSGVRRRQDEDGMMHCPR